MKKQKIFLIIFVGIFLLFLISSNLIAERGGEFEYINQIRDVNGIKEIHFFEQRGCPDCDRQKEFMEEYIKPKYPDLEIIIYSVMISENQEKFHQMMEERGVEDYKLIVPTTFIGDNYFQNFYEKDKELIIRAINGENVQEEILIVREEGIINIPFIGEFEVSRLSIPVLALVLGSIDGLNVCSIGALILILTLVFYAFNSRKKILMYGGLFIFTTVLVYGLLIFVWTAIFHFLARFIGGINLFIGLAALIGGGFFFKKFTDFYRYGPSCEYSSNKYIVKTTKKLKKLFSENERTILLVLGVIFFAFIVTLIELPCSIGLPLVYAGVLASEGLSLMGYLFYVGLYLFFYMFIELIIFGLAVATKEIWFTESKWITWVYLFGSIVLFLLSYNYLIGF